MGLDFYRPPQTQEERAALLAPTGAPLYQTRHVAYASLLGTPVAGLLLIGLNEHRLGRTTRAIFAVMLAVAALGALLLSLGFSEVELTPETVMLWPAIWIVGPLMYAEHTQGIAVRVHVSMGVPLGSPWRAVGLGAAIGVGVLVLGLAVGVLADLSV